MVVIGRSDQQVVLKPHAADDHRADDNHGFRDGFDFFVQQDQKGRHKADDEHCPSHVVPGVEHGAFDNVGGLFRDVAVPDDDELGIEEIGPDQTEAEKEFAHVMKLGGFQTERGLGAHV